MSTPETPEWEDYRVLFQRRDKVGEHYEFTTVLATSTDHAEQTFLSSSHHGIDGVEVVQVVQSNGYPTGFPASPDIEEVSDGNLETTG